ncbi:uncharacterized protein LOC110683860 [Chenopodium quinoa]|uniref:uncharacterized protein LOC110683860 n=1 Tax=Chenopodium quinoa TaxID=63459 RepID=UPI000B76E82B|nr:uncharacterized protein LOC110683860 [Chenopodium quinoa]
MFQDNKASRASHLEQELADLDFENFSSIDGYCNHIKSLADRLADADAPIPDTRLILKMTAGLPEAYAGMVDFIQNQEPLPSFESCRSCLKLAERTIKNRLAKEGGPSSRPPTALVSSTGGNQQPDSMAQPYASRSVTKNAKQNKKTNSKNSSKPRNSGGSAQQQSGNGQPWQYSQGPYPWPGWAPWMAQWTNPPCPYPARSWTPRPASSQTTSSRPGGPGILGQHPQAYSAINPSPTDIKAAIHVLANLGKPDNNYYMDTGATAHMTDIVVGSGDLIPIIGHGSTNLPSPYPPFTLNNVLHAPKLIKNLISVRKFTTDNQVSIAFDPYGFSVLDLQTGATLMRCDSTGDLYPIFPSNQANSKVNHSNFIALSSDLWHRRLGHPGDAVFTL